MIETPDEFLSVPLQGLRLHRRRRQQERQEWTASSLPRPSNVAWWRLALKVS